VKKPRQVVTVLLLVSTLGVSDATKSLAESNPSNLSAPAKLGFNAEHLGRIDGQIVKEIEKGNLPGCVILIGRREGIAFAKAFGHRQVEPCTEEMTLDTVFDMASITKPVATATSIMLLVERGQLRLGDTVATSIPEFGQNGKETITIEQLLTHQGGLVPDNPLEDYEHGTEEAWKRIWELKPVEPVGTKFVYSDVGFIVLAEVIRRVTGQSVDEFARDNIFQPLGMSETGYLPAEPLRKRSAMTEKREGQWMRGEVHDPRSHLLGGVAGHAGLFSTAGDLAKYARMILHDGRSGDTQLLSANTIAEMRRPREIGDQHRALGWDSRSKYSTNRGELMSDSAIGHGGFTGNGLWIDPELNLFVIFLSSRLHPDGVGNVNPLIGRVGTIAAAAIRGEAADNNLTDDISAVSLGIDVLQHSEFKQLAGRKVGLITNHTGLDSSGRRTIDLLHTAKNLKLVAVFSPEHGPQGQLDQKHIDDARDEATGLPVFSLYGKSRKPQAVQLDGIDTLVFDIQDIGARFYTYISTMGLALETAAEHKLKFVVLDRPNPIGGDIVEGPMLQPGQESFVAPFKLPVRHGMTVGELARLYVAEKQLAVNLEVIQIQAWDRTQYWDRTGLMWTNPSPNMRSLTEATLYPGIGLLETTNISVGRGTNTPFEVLGAPWLDGVEFARNLNSLDLAGVTFVPIKFTPDASKFAEESCQGVNVIVTDRERFRPVQTGLAIAVTLRKLYEKEWDVTKLNRLLANNEVLEAIKNGATLAELDKLSLQGLDEFLERRNQALLYK
jgi:uncharacterized protein YbbC (DUF1343 family)/CubicO group peptidase (beta-lactamase class C family)